MVEIKLNKADAIVLLRAIRGLGVNSTEKRFVIDPLVDYLQKEISGLCKQCFDNNCEFHCSNIACVNSYEEIMV